MSKSRQKGFGNTPKKQFSKSRKTHIPTAQTAKAQQALQLINQGKLNEAELIYRELAAASQNPTVHGNLGALLKMRGDTKNAITCFRKALQLKPNYPEAHNNLGLSLQEKGDLTSAITSYNKALQLKPDFPEAHYNLGNALQEKGDLTAAIASYNSALQLKPNYPEAHNNLGVTLQEQGDLTAAIDSYNSALQLKPNYPDALLGTLYVIEDARGLEDLKAKVRRAADFDRNILNNPQYVELIASLGGKFMRDILSSKLSAY